MDSSLLEKPASILVSTCLYWTREKFRSAPKMISNFYLVYINPRKLLCNPRVSLPSWKRFFRLWEMVCQDILITLLLASSSLLVGHVCFGLDCRTYSPYYTPHLLLSAARFDQLRLTLSRCNALTSDIYYCRIYMINYMSGSWSLAHEHQCSILLSNGRRYNVSLGSRFVAKCMYS